MRTPLASPRGQRASPKGAPRFSNGQGLGSRLLLDALERIVEAADLVGGRVIAVDAVDTDAQRSYVHHGFQPIEGSSRLVMKLATARAALGAASRPAA